MTQPEIAAAVWAALGQVAGKELDRDLLAPGTYQVGVSLDATVKGKAFSRRIGAATTVNEPQTRISAKGADTAHLVALLLEKLPPRQRASLLKQLPEQFAKAGNVLPPVDAGLVESADGLLKRLRAKVQQEVRGAMSTTYLLE